jgi:hypothetical protein
LETSCIVKFPTPPDTGEANQRRENRSMEETEVETARVLERLRLSMIITDLWN